jgi:hypothetical protein
MNKEEKYYPDHDLVKYDGDYDTMMDSLDNRYEEGDSRCTKFFNSFGCNVSVEKLDNDRKWVFYKVYSSWSDFKDEELISLKICPDRNGVSLPYEHTDYVFPRTNTAYLSKLRTEKLRRKRGPKPAKVVRREEEQE